MGNQEFLEEVREKSWAGELIISSLFVFSLWQVDSYLGSGYIPANLRFLGLVGEGPFFLLSIGFGLHLMTRAIWLALIGLSSLRFFDNRNEDLEKLIDRYNSHSVKIFSYSLVLFFLLISIIIFFAILPFTAVYLWPDFFKGLGIHKLIIPVWLFLGLLLSVNFGNRS